MGYASSTGFERRNQALDCFRFEREKETSVVFLYIQRAKETGVVFILDSGFVFNV